MSFIKIVEISASRPAISGIDIVTRMQGDEKIEYSSKIRHWDKIKAPEALAKYLIVLNSGFHNGTI